MYCRPLAFKSLKKKKDQTEFIELVIDILSIPENNKQRNNLNVKCFT